MATGDVHHFTREDKIYREIIVHQKVPGGGRHPLSKTEITNIPSQHFRTTKEMLEDFNFLDPDLAYEIVVTNTNKVLDMVEEIEVIINNLYVRDNPNGNILGYIKEGIYDILDSKFAGNYTWYKIGEGYWIAYNEGYDKLYVKEEEKPDTPKEPEEPETPKEKTDDNEETEAKESGFSKFLKKVLEFIKKILKKFGIV